RGWCSCGLHAQGVLVVLGDAAVAGNAGHGAIPDRVAAPGGAAVDSDRAAGGDLEVRPDAPDRYGGIFRGDLGDAGVLRHIEHVQGRHYQPSYPVRSSSASSAPTARTWRSCPHRAARSTISSALRASSLARLGSGSATTSTRASMVRLASRSSWGVTGRIARVISTM